MERGGEGTQAVPDSGFALCERLRLFAAMRALGLRHIRPSAFAVFLGVFELFARVSASAGRRRPVLVPELSKVLDLSERVVVRGLVELKSAGLVEGFSRGGLQLTRLESLPEKLTEGFEEFLRGHRRDGRLPIPRAMLRKLVRIERREVLIEALVLLLRCVKWRRGVFHVEGLSPASLSSECFALPERSVRRARAALLSLGWFSKVAKPSWHIARWGVTYRCELWARAVEKSEVEANELTRPAARHDRANTPESSPSSRGRGSKNQKPEVPSGPTGICAPHQETEPETNNVLAPPLGTPIQRVGEGSQKRVRLTDVREENLRSVQDLLTLFGQAVERGWVKDSYADKLKFLGAAERALEKGTANKPGFFVRVVRDGTSAGLWKVISNEEENRARVKLNLALHGGSASPLVAQVFEEAARERGASVPAVAGQLSLSDDARLVATARRAARPGQDPFFLARAYRHDLTRERYERAWEELANFVLLQRREQVRRFAS